MRVGVAVALALALSQAAVAAGRAQAVEHPRIVSIRFNGVHRIDEDQLKQAIATHASRCRSVLIAPFCWISDSPSFVERHFLDRAELTRDELRLRVLYYERGYREAAVASHVVGGADADEVDVVFDVTEGPPTLVARSRVVQHDSVLPSGTVRGARVPRPDERLDLIKLDSAELKLRNALWDRGYADALVTDTIAIAPDSRRAEVRVYLVPGALTTVDTIVVRGNENVSAATIRNLLTLGPGKLYRLKDVVESQRNLYTSDLFRLATIEVAPQGDSSKQVVVSVHEAPMHGARLSAGFNTLDFGQAEAQYTAYNLGGGARHLELRGVFGNLLAPQLNGAGIFQHSVASGFIAGAERSFLVPTWQASVEVRQPWFNSPRNSIGVSVFAHRRIVPGIVVDRGYGASASFTRHVASDITASLDYHFEVTRVAAGDVYYCVDYGICVPQTIEALRGSRTLSPLTLSFNAARTDQPLDPSSGYRIRVDLEHASRLTASDFRYDRVAAEGTRYLPLSGGRVLAGHLRFGWIGPLSSTEAALGVSGAADLVHPRKRFYAGGSRSVRGYGENQLGPRVLTIDPTELTDTTRANPCTIETIAAATCDPAGVPSSAFNPAPLGGNSVVEGSIEYRFPLFGALAGAVFLDAGAVGNAGNPFRGGHAAATPGFGVRYRSPVGAIRVDLGIKPTLRERLPVVTQVPGPDGTLQLVRLQQTKLFDPIGGGGGLFRQVIDRLRLHLSIGQAF